LLKRSLRQSSPQSRCAALYHLGSEKEANNFSADFFAPAAERAPAENPGPRARRVYQAVFTAIATALCTVLAAYYRVFVRRIFYRCAIPPAQRFYIAKFYDLAYLKQVGNRRAIKKSFYVFIAFAPENTTLNNARFSASDHRNAHTAY
jgi:hypothetical protein